MIHFYLYKTGKQIEKFKFVVWPTSFWARRFFWKIIWNSHNFLTKSEHTFIKQTFHLLSKSIIICFIFGWKVPQIGFLAFRFSLKKPNVPSDLLRSWRRKSYGPPQKWKKAYFQYFGDLYTVKNDKLTAGWKPYGKCFNPSYIKFDKTLLYQVFKPSL